jgi:hypothetical protein
MMETILPGTQHAFNLAYSAPNPADREAVEKQVLLYARPRHVLLELNWHYQRPRHGFEQENGFPLALYDGTVWNAVREVGINTLWLTVLDLEGKPLWLSHWSDAETERHFADEHRHFVSPASLATAERVIELHKHDVANPTPHGCSDFDTISGELVPFAQALAARHVPLDIIIPPYSLYIYYYFMERSIRLELAGPSFMNDQLKMRACAVKALARFPNVRFFAFDNVPGIADNLANYYDTAHPASAVIYQYILQSIAKNQNRLTAANVDGEMDRLRARILEYHATATTPWQPPQ